MSAAKEETIWGYAECHVTMPKSNLTYLEFETLGGFRFERAEMVFEPQTH